MESFAASVLVFDLMNCFLVDLGEIEFAVLMWCVLISLLCELTTAGCRVLFLMCHVSLMPGRIKQLHLDCVMSIKRRSNIRN